MDYAIWALLFVQFFAGGLTPGPAVLLVMRSSLKYGPRLAMLPALGISTANLIWIVLAATSVATLAAQFPNAFFGLKMVSLAVIAWLAWSMATANPSANKLKSQALPPRARLFAYGVGLQLLNPSALVFFGGLLPAYFDTESSLLVQSLIVMATVTVTEMLGLSVYAWGASAMQSRLQNPVFARAFNIGAALLVFVSAALAIVLTSI